MKVRVVEYHAKWPEMFIDEKNQLAEIFKKHVVYIEHVGSTSIPNIHAKPIIDILISVNDIQEIDELREHFQKLGYEVKGEFGIPGRRYFTKDTEGERSHQIHMFQHGNPELKRHQLFRDYMIAHPEEAKKYAELKIELAKLFPDDIQKYAEGKNDFIKEIDKKAKEWREAMSNIETSEKKAETDTVEQSETNLSETNDSIRRLTL